MTTGIDEKAQIDLKVLETWLFVARTAVSVRDTERAGKAFSECATVIARIPQGPMKQQAVSMYYKHAMEIAYYAGARRMDYNPPILPIQ